MKEYEWSIDTVIELPDDVDPVAFHGALVDAIVDLVEGWDGRIGGNLGRLVEWEEVHDDEEA